MTENKEIFVLDTSAILNGVADLISPDNFVPPEVLDEIREGDLSRIIEYSGDLMNVASPSIRSIESVRSAAERTGDLAKMSKTDIVVAALALELKATVLSNDYCIQNVCSVLNVRFRGVSMKQIEKTVMWNYFCTGCGKRFDDHVSICPVCGHETKRRGKAIKGSRHVQA